MATTSNSIKKAAMIEALEKSLGVVTDACKIVGINRKTHYEWLKNDEQYKQDVDDLSNAALDFVESKLYEKIKGGDTTCIIFYMKTKGKERGYVERQEHKLDIPQFEKMPDIIINAKDNDNK